MEKFKLEYPIDLTQDGQNVITELTVNRLKAKHMREASAKRANGYEFSDYIIGKSTGLTLAEMGEMDAADYDALVDKITPFLSRGKDSVT